MGAETGNGYGIGVRVTWAISGPVGFSLRAKGSAREREREETKGGNCEQQMRCNDREKKKERDFSSPLSFFTAQAYKASSWVRSNGQSGLFGQEMMGGS